VIAVPIVIAFGLISESRSGARLRTASRKDETANQGGADADPGGRAHSGNPGPGSGDPATRARARSHRAPPSRSGEIPVRERQWTTLITSWRDL